MSIKDHLGKKPRFLFIAIAGIGNHVMLTPAYTNVKKNFPHAHVSVLCLGNTKQLLDNNQYVDEVLVYPHQDSFLSRLQYLFSLRKKKFDVVFYAFPNLGFSCAVMMLATGARYRLNYSYSAFGMKHVTWFNSTKILLNEDMHDLDKNMNLLREIPLKVFTKQYHVPLSSSDKKHVDGLLKKKKIARPLIAVQVGSGNPQKNLAVEHFYGLIKRIQKDFSVDIVLVGGAAERKAVKKSIFGKHVHNCMDSTNLTQTTELLRRCKLLITNDSGPMHLAVTAGTPVFAFFLIETIRRTPPVGKDDVVYTLTKFKKGIDKNKNHHYLDEITVDGVYPALAKRLKHVLRKP